MMHRILLCKCRYGMGTTLYQVYTSNEVRVYEYSSCRAVGQVGYSCLYRLAVAARRVRVRGDGVVYGLRESDIAAVSYPVRTQ